MKLFIATSNPNKVKEMKEILADFDLEILSKEDVGELPEVKEDKSTFAGNALKKAKVIQQEVGIPTVADDSGLAVDALDGKPGVYSARFAGEDATDQDNNRKLLGLLSGLEDDRRRAHFVCVMAFIDTTGDEEIVEGRCHGEIGFEPRGNNGFGYDPLFIPEGYKKTFAELDSRIKNKISHRAKALDKLKRVLAEKDLK